MSNTPTSSASIDNLLRNATAALPTFKLSRKNYLTWYPEFRLALETVNLWTVVSGEDPAPVPANASTPTAAEKAKMDSWKKKDSIARLLIMRSVEDDFKVDILEMKTATAMWEKISDLSRSKGAIGVVYWICQLAKASYAEGSDLQAHFTTMKEYASELKHAKFPIHETVTAALMVNSMPDSYDNVTSTLPQDSLLIADIERHFLMENRRCIDRAGNGGVDNVLIGRSSSNLYCTNCKKTLHEYKDCWSPGGGSEGKGPKH